MQVRQLRNVLSRTANTKALSAGLGRRRASRRVGGRPRSSVVALVPRAAPAAPCAARPLPHATGRRDPDRIRRRGEPRRRGDRPSARPPVRRRRGGDSGALLSQSVTVSQLFHGPTPVPALTPPPALSPAPPLPFNHKYRVLTECSLRRGGGGYSMIAVRRGADVRSSFYLPANRVFPVA